MKPWYQQREIAARAYDGPWMRSLREMPPRRQAAGFKLDRVMMWSRKVPAINNPRLQGPRQLYQGYGRSFSKEAKKVQDEKAGSGALPFSLRWVICNFQQRNNP
jgi:hypothetical protein